MNHDLHFYTLETPDLHHHQILSRVVQTFVTRVKFRAVFIMIQSLFIGVLQAKKEGVFILSQLHDREDF